MIDGAPPGRKRVSIGKRLIHLASARVTSLEDGVSPQCNQNLLRFHDEQSIVIAAYDRRSIVNSQWSMAEIQSSLFIIKDQAMNNMSLTIRFVSAIAALAVVITLFDSVVLMSGTLPDVKVARATQAERLARDKVTLVAAAPAASSVR